MAMQVDEFSPSGPLRDGLDRIQSHSLRVGGIGLVLCVLGGFIWPQQLFSSYLVAFLFWVGVALGCIGLAMLHHLVGGQWGVPIRRPLEAGAMTLVSLALLFLPLLLGLQRLYPWARPGELEHDADLSRKSAYLNVPFFTGRAALYFVVWITLAFLLSRLSRRQDESQDPAPSRWLQALSGPGLVVLFLTGSFAAIDWGMSLEPRWASTIYGAMMITGDALSTLALITIVVVRLSSDEPMREVASSSRLHDLGNLMLAFVMLWAYMAFSQFLIIWSGNLSEETPWYVRRTHGGWQWVALLLIGVHFFLPFFVLLFRETKEHARLLVRVAWLIIVMHLVDLVWLVIPATADSTDVRVVWAHLPLILAATAGIGGIWAAMFLWQLKGAPLVPIHDPHVTAAIHHHKGD